MNSNTNHEIAAIIRAVGETYTDKGNDRFRKKAHETAARIIGEMTHPVYLFAKLGRLETLPGIGKGIAQKITDFLRFGEVNGISLDNIVEKEKRYPREQFKPLVEYMLETFSIHAVEPAKYVIAGSWRRGKPTVHDLDLVISPIDVELLLEDIKGDVNTRHVLWSGPKKISVMMGGESDEALQVDFRIFEPESFGAGLLFLTGSKEFNVDCRIGAKKHGLKLNEYGLWDGENCVASETEEEILGVLFNQFIDPEFREAGVIQLN